MNATRDTAAAGRPVRWGIAGTGAVARDFVVPALVASDGSRVDACVGSSVSKGGEFAEMFGVRRVHENVQDLMEDPDLDAVYIALPNAMHLEAVLAAAANGKHALCEKPLALRYADAVEMTRAAENAGTILRVAHQMRLYAAVRHARDVVQSGRLGRVVAASLERASGLGARHGWRHDPTQSGVVYDVGVHLLDLIQWITGRRYVDVCGFTYPDRQSGSPDDAVTVLGRLEDGCQAVVRAVRDVANAENNLIIHGDAATLVTSALRFASEHVVSVRDHGGTVERRFPADPAYALEVAAFEGELRGERSLLPDGTEGAGVVAVTEAVLRSAEERRVVEIDQIRSERRF